jgi:hypothetical protein
MPPRMALNFVYAYLIRNADKEGREQFDAELYAGDEIDLTVTPELLDQWADDGAAS